MSESKFINKNNERHGVKQISRRDMNRVLITGALSTGSLTLLSSKAMPATPPSANPEPRSVLSSSPQTLTLRNSQFELSLTPGTGLLCRLVHRPSGILLADGFYSYSFGMPVLTEVGKHDGTVVLHGNTGTGIAVEHRFSVDPESSWIEEKITLSNTRSHPLVMSFRCGFVLPVRGDTLRSHTFTAVPFRREPYGHRKQYADYSLEQILYQGRRSRLPTDPDWPYDDAGILKEFPELQKKPPPPKGAPFTEDFASEGWTFTNGRNGFLITKYTQAAPEFALLDRVPLEDDLSGLRWGGAGVAASDLEGYLHLAPGATHEFGISRLTSFQGDLVQGYYAFRAEMESRRHGVPNNFDPPLHWNEIYDNKLYFCGEWVNQSYAAGTWSSQTYLDPKNREKLYTLKDMKEEARKAQAMGCEALYLDPGWDTPQSSKIWDPKRLGDLSDFIAMLKNEYGGLKLSLHTPLAAWYIAQYDKLMPGGAKVDASGNKTLYPCGASSQYLEETARRLRVLADAGVCFFMFDGNANIGECWDPHHGHSVPLTQPEYVDATNRLARMVHQTHPKVLVEMHGRGEGSVGSYYVPTYYGHGVDASGIPGFSEIWAFELMLNSMADLLGGNSMTLYYYNLAYSLPLYLHIDLRTDNTQCITFWWNASTCRHLGIGGTHADPAVVAAQKKAIATYRRLKRYFTAGVFYGIDEMTHVHSDRDGKSAVMNYFNLEDQSAEREIRFQPAQFGLSSSKTYRFSGATFERSGDAYIGKVSIPASGHTLIEVA